MPNFNKTLLAVAITLASTQTMAAGFQLNSQSATGIGRAFSGDAVIADNASVLSRNPAAMAMFDKKSLSVGLTHANIDVEVSNVAMAAGNYGSVDDAAENKLIPNAYYIQPISDKLAFGVAAFSNFGTGTDLSSLANTNPIGADGNPVPAPAPVDLLGVTEVTTMNFNASVSYRFNEHFSIGAGLDVVYGEGKLDRSGNLPFGPGGAMTPVQLVDVDASGVAFGGIVGAVYEINANNRIGMSYRISPDLKASGDIYTVNQVVVDVPGGPVPGVASTTFDEINIPLPDIFQVAGFHQVTEKFALHYTAQLTTWGDFHQIDLHDGTSSIAVTIPGVGDTTVDATIPSTPLKQYQWDDSWLFSIGGTYTINDQWTARIGFMHDQGVVNEISSLSIPDSDRNWYTAGVSYAISPTSTIDFGLAFVRGQEVKVIEHSAVIEAIPNIPTGDISATTHSNAMYTSLQYSYQF